MSGDIPNPDVTNYGIDAAATFDSNADYSNSCPPLIPGCPNPRNTAGAPQPCNDSFWAAHSSSAIVDHTLDHIDTAQQLGKPFYVNAWFHVSHAVLAPTPPQLVPYPFEKVCRLPAIASNQTTCSQQIFYASQTNGDTQIGRLFKGLESRGLWGPTSDNNTLVILSTDNGPEEPRVFPNAVGTTGRLRGRKRSIYDGGIRVPLMMSWPGKFGPSRFEDAPVGAVDWVRIHFSSVFIFFLLK